jgi:hypothetical protein
MTLGSSQSSWPSVSSHQNADYGLPTTTAADLHLPGARGLPEQTGLQNLVVAVG